jgi:glycosyltransferase involved in cell wall biosynthesis
MKVLIIIPVYNEACTIREVLENLRRSCPGYDLLVVNDASTDQSGEIAGQAGMATVLHLPYNLGIGGCVQTGFRFAAANGYDIAVQFDGDGQHNPEDVSRLVDMISSGACDVAIGSRFHVKEAISFRSTTLRRIGIKIFQGISHFLILQRITDHTSGFRAFNRKAILLLAQSYPVDYPEPEVIVLLARNRYRIRETFTQMYARQGGVSSIPLYKGPYYMTKVLLSMVMAAVRARL